jgi:molybdopterin-biosynthesis enzyme MoeA-like protein
VTAFVGESQIAGALREIQDQYPQVDLGSYPFFRQDRYGTSLVMRGTNENLLDEMLEAVKAAIVAAGETPQDVQHG